MLRLITILLLLGIPLNLSAQSCDDLICVQGFACDEVSGEPSDIVTGELLSEAPGYCGLQQRFACKLTQIEDLQSQLSQLQERSSARDRVLRRLRRRLRQRRR